MSEFDKLHPSLQYHVVNSLGWSRMRPTQLQAIAPILSGVNCLLLKKGQAINGALVSLTKDASGGVRLLTFAGTREAEFNLAIANLPFSADEVTECAKAIKFSDCLPGALLIQIIRMRQFEPFLPAAV